VKRNPQVPGDRLPLLITAAVFVVLLACLPPVLRLDNGLDSDRPMYQDMERMRALQSIYIATGQPPVETKLRDGDAVMIGTTEFIVSDGVTLTVRATKDDAFCISASNQDGTKSKRCSE